MPDLDAMRDRRRRFERHAQTFLLTLATAASLGLLKIGLDAATKINAIGDKVDRTAIDVSTMYRASDAARDMLDIGKRLDSDENRIDGNEKRIDSLDHRLRYVEEHPTAPVHRP